MTIASANSRNDYTGNGSAATFAFSFPIKDSSDLRVVKRNTSTGAETVLVLTTDYTVTGVGLAAGGSITLTGGNLATGYKLTIRRKRPATQLSSFRNQTDFLPASHEDALDSLSMVDSSQQDDIDRSVRLPETVPASSFDPKLPAAVLTGGGMSIRVKSTNDGLELGVPTEAAGTVAGYVTAAAASATAAAASATSAATAAASAGAVTGISFRRPVLQYVDASNVDVEMNSLTAGRHEILFPDGALRFTTNATHYRFNITRNANLTTGQSGLAATLVEASNQWYAIYAVKSADGEWTAVGDVRLPIQANVAALNTEFGVNGWVYLGMIRNGNNASRGSDIISFVMAGAETYFNPTTETVSASAMGGLKLVSAASGTSGLGNPSYVATSGTGTTDLPSNIGSICVGSSITPDNTSGAVGLNNTFGGLVYFNTAAAAGIPARFTTWTSLKDVWVFCGTSWTNALIQLLGFRDSILQGVISPRV